MELSDQKYSELKKDRQISEAIAMIKSSMVDDKAGRIKKEQEHYIGYAEYLSKTITTFENLINDSEAMDLLKIDKYLQYYLYELRKSKYAEPEAVSALEKLKNDPHLTSLLDFKVSDYIQYQINQLKKSKKSFLKSHPRRIGSNINRDIWLGDIILKLKLKGIKKESVIIDFIFRLYKEFNILDLEYKIDKVVKDDKDYNLEIEIVKVYDLHKDEIKSNIRKIVKNIFPDWKEYYNTIF